MYFKNRTEAGQKLAEGLDAAYAQEGTVVMALGYGSVPVGAKVAERFRCTLSLLPLEDITLPKELDPLMPADQSGGMTDMGAFTPGQIEDFNKEYRNYIDFEKMRNFHRINNIIWADGLMDRELLHGYNVILVADGCKDGFALDAAANFLKPVRLNRLVIAVPIASVQAADRMHVLADDIYCLSVIENYISTDHYYEEQDVPDRESALEVIRQTSEQGR